MTCWPATSGAAPRFFDAADLPTAKPGPCLSMLRDWSKALSQAARTAEHPFNAGLLLESLATQAQRILHLP